MFEAYFFNFYYSNFIEDLLVILLIYNFIKLLIISIINELTWPTHYFNKKHNIGFTYYKLRTYFETINKLLIYDIFFKNYYLCFFKNILN